MPIIRVEDLFKFYFRFPFTALSEYTISSTMFCTGALCNLTVEHDGVITSERQFCVGVQLTFTCTILRSTFDWIFPPFLNGTLRNGRVSLGNTETVGEFTLTASGFNDRRKSTLQVTLFKRLVGDTNVTCVETGTTNNRQSATITVLRECSVIK